MTETPATGTSYQRTFYPSDYRKAASLVRNFRHLRCQPGSPKPPASQDKADQMAAAMAAVFASDADAPGFSVARFVEGSRLPEPASYPQASDDTDEAGDDENDTAGGLLP